MDASKPIFVTEPSLPPIEEYIGYLEGIWERNWLTNAGPLHVQLEQELRDYHQLSDPVHCVANGALGLQIALKALDIRGEIVTTPFSYVATVSCPLWEGCTLRFADIERDCLTIDPAAVEDAVTKDTEAILATHVFGNPCDVEALQAIAGRHGLALIYDAAHAFGVRYQNKSILEYGDVSMVSMHATKLFHTVEGGFVVARDGEVSERIEWMRRFGHKGAVDFHGVATNAKMSEFHAAMGLCNLQRIETILERRHAIIAIYRQRLAEVADIIPAFSLRDGCDWNAAYFPVLFRDESHLLAALQKLSERNIHARRYFYPLLNHEQLAPAHGPLAVAEDIAVRIACLPLSEKLVPAQAEQIMEIIVL